MKGISAVIATLIMLIITIGLAGLAYSYISGVFTSKTSVVLSVDGSSYCNSTHIIAYIRNDGTTTSGAVTVTAYDSNGNQIGTGSIASIASGEMQSTAIARGGASGFVRIIASTTGASASGYVNCP